MQRTLQALGKDPAQIFIDSSASCDQTNCSITTLLIPSKAGAVPVCVCLHANQTENNYTEVFGLANQIFQQVCPEFHMTAFMSDNASALKNALQNVWPKIRQLLCLFHLLAAFWTWVFVSKNQVKTNDRPKHMNNFKKVVYSASEKEVEEAKKNFLCQCEDNEKLKKYFLNHWKDREEWCIFYRLGLITRAHNTNNYSEATFRVFKDIILCRLKAHNALSLLSFVANDLDEYYAKRLTNHAYGRVAQRNNPKFVQTSERAQLLVQSFEEKFEKVSDGIYKVPASDGETTYCVNSTIGHCSCVSGGQGGYCKHQAAVAILFKVAFPNSPRLTPQDKSDLYYIANNSRVNLSFFSPLQQKSDLNGSEEIIKEIEDNAISCEKSDGAKDMGDIFQSGDEFDTDDENIPPPTKRPRLDAQAIISEFENAYLNMKELLEQNTTDDFVLKSVQTFSSSAKKLQTGMQLAAFCSSSKLSRPRAGGKIAVQPTSINRRKTTNSKSRRVMRSGRPLSGIKRPAKRPRDLALNVACNRLNAKSHGDGH